jgi:AraC-like DNA-binding protein
MPALQSAHFSTGSLPRAEQFSAWRASIAPLFDAAVTGAAAQRGFAGESTAYYLGPLVVGETQFAAHRYERSARLIALERSDHHLVRYHRRGGYRGTTSDGALTVRAGDIDVVDFGREIAIESRASALVVIAMPRDFLTTAFPRAGTFHGLVLDGRNALAGLLGDYMTALARRLPTLTDGDVADVADATLAMLRVCLRPSVEARLRALPSHDAALVDQLKQHIEAMLATRELSPEALCRSFGLSRSQLYRLFMPLGGVTRYIQTRRLQRSFLTLIDPAHRGRRIAEIAFECGFGNEAHFSAGFRRAFGLTPTDARTLGRDAHLLERRRPSSIGDQYRDWHDTLGR